MTRRVLVTGGSGFIGSAVIRYAIRHTEAEVVNVDKLTYAATPEALEEAADSPRYRFVRADVADAGAMAAVLAEHRPDAVMHLAAESHVDRSIDGPRPFVETNVVGTYVLLEAVRAHLAGLDDAARAAFRFHHVSTDEVFGALGADDPAFDEATPYRPRSPYAASKAAADHFLPPWGQSFDLTVVVSHCSNNYGPWQYPEKLIPVTIAAALDGRPLPVYGAGEQVRDWLHVEDHAEALWTVLNLGTIGRTYAIGGGAERRNIDLVRTLCRLLDRLAPRPGGGSYAEQIAFVADRPGHDFRYAIDAGRVRRELGWVPRHGFEDGLEATVRWYLAHAGWWRALRDAGRRRGLGGAA